MLPSRSYVFSSLASAAVSFATGAFGIWIPQYLFRAQVVQKTAVSCTYQPCSSKDRSEHTHTLIITTHARLEDQPPYMFLSHLQFDIRGHHLRDRIVGSGDRRCDHASLSAEDGTCRPPGVCGQHAGLRHLHLPHLCCGKEEHCGRICKCLYCLVGNRFSVAFRFHNCL